MSALLPLPDDDAAPEDLLGDFQDWVEGRGISMYPHQDEALMEIAAGAHTIVATPTGSGKSLIALGAHYLAAGSGGSTFYTAPIKALVSEKFFDLCATFGAENVGMMTGDATVNREAPIICCTAEILAQIALAEGTEADVDQVVMDEFHYYAEPDRGWAWQVPLLELPDTQFILMSATLGDTSWLEKDLVRRSDRGVAVVAGAERPIPLSFEYATDAIHDTITELLRTSLAPVYIVSFTQKEALERAQSLMSVPLIDTDEKNRIKEALHTFRFSKGFGQTLSKLLRAGIGVHHAGMLPKYRRLVEQLAQQGLLKVICGTDTLGVGINVPIRTVVLSALTKFDGTKQRILRAREFHQIAGRAGRAGFDTAGTVVVQAPPHVIENAKALAKAGDDPKKRKKVRKVSPPEGFVSWTDETFDRLVAAPPEPLQSRMQINQGMILTMSQRPGDLAAHVRRLIEESHEPMPRQRRLKRKAVALGRSLLSAGVMERLAAPDRDGRIARIRDDVGDHFALNQPLSQFGLAALELLDPESSESYLDVVSVVEAVIEDPRQVLIGQSKYAKGEAVARMKADGMDYTDRMTALEDITWPKPLEDLLETALASYREGHPWVPLDALSPKSVVRDMFERGLTFGEYVAFYGLTRVEGTLLRYLTDVYRALRQTVPDSWWSDELDDLYEWLGETIRQTDSSLLDEWDAMMNPDAVKGARESVVIPLSRRPALVRQMVRRAMWGRLQLVDKERFSTLASLDDGLSERAWRDAWDDFLDAHDDLLLTPEASNPQLLVIDESDPRRWEVQQVMLDTEGDSDFRLFASVDLDACDAAGELELVVTDMGTLG